jgi:hypothetical protein
METLKSGDDQAVQNAVFALVGIGREDTIGGLVKILQEKGTATIANVFLNCGNAILRDAAREWASRSGTGIDAPDSSYDIEWGGMKQP